LCAYFFIIKGTIMATLQTSESVPTQVNKMADQKIDQASSSMHGAVDKLSEAAKPAADRVAAGAQTAMEALAKAVSKASEAMGASAEQLSDLQERAVGSARTLIRAKPLTVIGIAVAAGFLLSRLMSSR
jgi:ElaB/YqjD/DUF883 family membrane-anchored ribosome-binding protein